MMYENDKLNIPEKYRNMSVSELRQEKDKVYMQVKRTSSKKLTKKNEGKREKVIFYF